MGPMALKKMVTQVVAYINTELRVFADDFNKGLLNALMTYVPESGAKRSRLLVYDYFDNMKVFFAEFTKAIESIQLFLFVDRYIKQSTTEIEPSQRAETNLDIPLLDFDAVSNSRDLIKKLTGFDMNLLAKAIRRSDMNFLVQQADWVLRTFNQPIKPNEPFVLKYKSHEKKLRQLHYEKALELYVKPPLTPFVCNKKDHPKVVVDGHRRTDWRNKVYDWWMDWVLNLWYPKKNLINIPVYFPSFPGAFRSLSADFPFYPGACHYLKKTFS